MPGRRIELEAEQTLLFVIPFGENFDLVYIATGQNRRGGRLLNRRTRAIIRGHVHGVRKRVGTCGNGAGSWRIGFPPGD